MAFPRIPLWLVLAAVGLVLWLGYGWSQRRQGELRAKIQSREHVIAVQAESLAATRGRIPKVDTVRVRDARAAFEWASRYQKLRDSLVARGVPDSSTAVLILGTADSAVGTCTRALQSCANAIALRDTALWQAGALISQKDSLLRDVKRQRPGFFRRTFGCAAGLAATTQGAGLGAACGVRFP